MKLNISPFLLYFITSFFFSLNIFIENKVILILSAAPYIAQFCIFMTFDCVFMYMINDPIELMKSYAIHQTNNLFSLFFFYFSFSSTIIS